MRSFFDLSDGGVKVDERGTELANLQKARSKAVRCTGELLRNEPAYASSPLGLIVKVCDRLGLELFA